MTSFHITPIAVVTLTKRGSITLYLEWPIYHPVLKFLNPRHIPGTGEASFQLSPWLQKNRNLYRSWHFAVETGAVFVNGCDVIA